MANYKVGSFVANDVTGLQTVAHGLGTTPKALILFGSNLPATGFNGHYHLTTGFVTKDGGTFQEYSVSATSIINVSPSDTSRRMAAKAYSMGTEAQTIWVEANIDSWDAINFVLNHTTVRAGSSYIVNYIAIGGADVTGAKASKFNLNTANGKQSVTGTGFQPDLVLNAQIGQVSTTLPVSATGAYLNFGAMDRYGNQFVNGITALDAVNPSTTRRFQYTNKMLSWNNSGENWEEAQFASMDTDGFSFNITKTGTSALPVVYLALKGPGVKVGAFQKTTAAAPASQGVTGVGFTPKAVLFSTMGTTPQTSPLAHVRWALGATSGASSSKAVAIRDRDSQATTSAQGYQDDKAVASLNDTAASTVDFAADLTSFNTDGFTLSFTTNDAVAREILYVAFGDTPAAEPAGTLSKVGAFAKPNSTLGHQQITGIGFRPKALIFWNGAHEATNGFNQCIVMLGMTTGSSFGYAVSTASNNGVSPSNTARRMAARAMTWVDYDANTVVGECDIVSLDSDGFTLNWTLQNAAAYNINYIAIGGADVTGAKVVKWNRENSVTGVGFQPSLVLNASVGLASFSGASEAILSFGAMDKYGNQWASAFRANDGVNPSDTRRAQRTDRARIILGTTDTILDSFSFLSMDPDGFSVTHTGTAVDGNISLCLKGPGMKVGAFQKTTAAAPASQSVTGTGFTPKTVLFSSVGIGAPSTAPDVGSLWSLGATSAAASKGIAIRDNDALATTSAQGYQANKAVASLNRATASTVAFEADLTTLDSSGFTLNWTTNDANPHEICYIAIGNAVTEATGTLTKVGSFNAPSATGHQQITGLGFRPKALIFYSANVATAGSFGGYMQPSLGFTTGSSSSYASAASSQNGQTPSNTSRRMAAKAITFVWVNELAEGEADLLSFDSDGFTLNWTIAAGHGGINYIAIGGEDVTGARAVNWDPSGVAGNQSYTGLDFQPHLLLIATIGTNALGSFAEGVLTFGAFDGTNQWGNGVRVRDASNPSDTSRVQKTDRIIVNPTSDATGLHEEVSAVSLDANGFTLNYISASGNQLIALCLKGPRFKVGSFAKDTGAAPDSQSIAGVGFLPKGVLLSTVGNATNTSPTAIAKWSLGAASGASSEKNIAIRDDDAVATTNAVGYQNDVLVTEINNSSSGLTSQGDLTSFDSDGFTINLTANDTSEATEILYLAIGAVIQDGGFTGWGWPI